MKKRLFFTIIGLGIFLTFGVVNAECGGSVAYDNSCNGGIKTMCDSAYENQYGTTPDCLSLTCVPASNSFLIPILRALCTSNFSSFVSPDKCYFNCTFMETQDENYYCRYTNVADCSREADCSASGCSSGGGGGGTGSGSILTSNSGCDTSKKNLCEAAYKNKFGDDPNNLYLTCLFSNFPLNEGTISNNCKSSSYSFEPNMCYYNCSYIKITSVAFCLFSQGETCSSESSCSISGCGGGGGTGGGGTGGGGTGGGGIGGGATNDGGLNLIYPSRLNIRLGMPLNELIFTLYNFIVWISGLATFAMFVWGGFDWLTSSGDSGKVTKAKEKLNSALTGLLLVLASYLILRTINPDLTTLINPSI
jgi:hypothetical protein